MQTYSIAAAFIIIMLYSQPVSASSVVPLHASLDGRFGFGVGFADLSFVAENQFEGNASGTPLGQSLYFAGGEMALNGTCFSNQVVYFFWTTSLGHPAELVFRLSGFYCPDLLAKPGFVVMRGGGTWTLVAGNGAYAGFSGGGSWEFEGHGKPSLFLEPIMVAAVNILGDIDDFQLDGMLSSP